jgi:hypothetical protein
VAILSQVVANLKCAVILAARTYALYGCSKKILALLVSTSVVGLIISCVCNISPLSPQLQRFRCSRARSLQGSLAMQPWDRPSTTFLGCHTSTSASSGVHIAVPWECLLTFDTMLIVLTLARGRLLAPREMWVGPGAPRDIRAVITRDGVLYYAVVAGANAANVLTFYLAPAVLRGVLSNPASALSTVLCARLMLNIRAAGDVAHPALPSTSAESTTGFDSRAAFTSRFALDEGPALDMEAARTSSKDAGSSLRQSSTWRSERERIELREMGPKCIPITHH